MVLWDREAGIGSPGFSALGFMSLKSRCWSADCYWEAQGKIYSQGSFRWLAKSPTAPPFFCRLRSLFVNCQLGQHLAGVSPFLVCVSLHFRASERSTNPSQAGKTLCLFSAASLLFLLYCISLIIAGESSLLYDFMWIAWDHLDNRG